MTIDISLTVEHKNNNEESEQRDGREAKSEGKKKIPNLNLSWISRKKSIPQDQSTFSRVKSYILVPQQTFLLRNPLKQECLIVNVKNC